MLGEYQPACHSSCPIGQVAMVSNYDAIPLFLLTRGCAPKRKPGTFAPGSVRRPLNPISAQTGSADLN